MLRLAAAELRYGAMSTLAWLAVMLVMAGWPLLETPSVSAVGSVIAFLSLVIPVVAVISAFRALSLEHGEGRMRLFRSLPLGTVAVAMARQIRGCALPLAGLLVAALLFVVGWVGMGRGFLALMAGGWVVGVLFLAGVAAVALVTLLYDLGGMSFAQIVMASLVGLAFVANAYVGAFAERVLAPVTAAAQTPAGLAACAAACLVLWCADVAVLRWKEGR